MINWNVYKFKKCEIPSSTKFFFLGESMKVGISLEETSLHVVSYEGSIYNFMMLSFSHSTPLNIFVFTDKVKSHYGMKLRLWLSFKIMQAQLFCCDPHELNCCIFKGFGKTQLFIVVLQFKLKYIYVVTFYSKTLSLYGYVAKMITH